KLLHVPRRHVRPRKMRFIGPTTFPKPASSFHVRSTSKTPSRRCSTWLFARAVPTPADKAVLALASADGSLGRIETYPSSVVEAPEALPQGLRDVLTRGLEKKRGDLG